VLTDGEIKKWEMSKNKRKGKNQKETDKEREKGCIITTEIRTCVFINAPLKSKYMTGLMGYWSSHCI